MSTVTRRRHDPPYAIPAARDARYDALVRTDGMVHRSLFTDPAIFDREMVSVFGGTWVFLLHETEIPDADDFKCVNVGRRPVIVTRTAEGDIRALLNRCTHRGTMVCVDRAAMRSAFSAPITAGRSATRANSSRVTFPEGYGAAFDKAAHNLGRLPRVESYRGYVFGSLNADVEPFVEWIGPARSMLDGRSTPLEGHGGARGSLEHDGLPRQLEAAKRQ